MSRTLLPGGAYEVRLKDAVVRGPLDAWVASLRRDGARAFRTVTIRKVGDRGAVGAAWTLSGSRVTGVGGGTPMSAKGTDVAMDELVLACEALDPP